MQHNYTRNLLLILIQIFVLNLSAQVSIPSNGVKESISSKYYLKNAKIYIDSKNVIDKASLIVENEQIVFIGVNPSEKLLQNAIEIDYSDKIIFPAFIELNTSIGLPNPTSTYRANKPQIESSRNLQYHWNDAIHPEYSIDEHFQLNKDEVEKLSSLGFGIALNRLNDGVAQGYGSMIELNPDTEKPIVLSKSSAHFSFNKGVSRQSYPSSQMGSIALLRQVFYDLKSYQANAEKKKNFSFDALAEQMKLPLFFLTDDKYEILRAQKIAKEFNMNFHYYGSGTEYEMLNDLKGLKSVFILPISFPKKINIKSPYDYDEVNFKYLKHWELAPANPALLRQQGNQIALSSKGISSEKEFWTNIRKAIKAGLSVEDAISSLTIVPAKIVNLEKQFGTLETHKIASFTVYSANPFIEEAVLLEQWSFGKRRILNKGNTKKLVAELEIESKDLSFIYEVNKGEPKKTKIKTLKLLNQVDTTFITNDFKFQDGKFSFHLVSKSLKLNYQFEGKISNEVINGNYLTNNGELIAFTGKILSFDLGKSDTLKQDTINYLSKIWYPNIAYGISQLPVSKTYLITNATVWTNESEGIIENASVLVKNGKIVTIGKIELNQLPKDVIQIDGTGKHLTSGIIDEHSHISISKGVNEGGQSITSEVRIGDVVRSDDINMYRQLAGGVTTSQLLHGSANAIGGQSAIIKLKWGESPENLLFPNAPQFIKFALGENVKQSNWGELVTNRFPQTRMGVEQVFYDGFLRAKKYKEDKKTFYTAKNNKSKVFPIDLELEALCEILEGKRFITCHSYVQSEINMLMKVADSMKFKVNTFTHILEGYKVADKMKKHGVGASTFADWWAYKEEVKDAIPFNAGILHKQGVVTAINSDDAEMGRRLNQEAAKIVKYSSISQEDAWKMVTLNPAKLLHIDDRVGSIKVGKDADLVLWSDNPLSIYAKVEKTMIDGKIYFDIESDKNLYLRNQLEKQRILTLMNLSKEDSAKDSADIEHEDDGSYHCNTLGEEMSKSCNEH